MARLIQLIVDLHLICGTARQRLYPASTVTRLIPPNFGMAHQNTGKNWMVVRAHYD